MSDPSLPYTTHELAMIQRAIAPAPPAPPAEFMAVIGTAPPDWMRPFWKLSDLEPDLFIRVSQDRWVMALAQYAFFPTVLEWRREGRSVPTFRTAGRTRGPVGILQSGDDQLAIKPFQNSREDEIASIAASVDAGPRQFPSLSGYLAEQFADGVFFSDLPPERRDAATMRSVGQQLGGMLRRLHEAGIYYNDATLADPQGRSHLIVADDGRCTLIDFRVSLLLDRHPQYSREEVHNFARTLPMYRIFAGMADNREEMDGFLTQFGTQMAQSSRQDILARDIKFAQQGLAIAGQKLGQDIIPPLRDGFLESYRPAED